MTAKELLDRLQPHGPRVEGETLAFDTPPPATLADALAVLHTGVRAAMTNRRWFGFDAAGHGVGPLDYHALRVDTVLPPTVVLLTVEGDAGWHRLPPDVREEHPKLFAKPVAAKAKGKAEEKEPAAVAGLW